MVMEDLQRPLDLISRRLGDLTPREVASAGVQAGIPRRRYRDGLIDRARWLQEMATLGYRGTDIEREWIVTTLDADTSLRSDLINAWITAHRKQRIDVNQLRLALIEQGVRDDMREAIIFGEQSRIALDDPSPETQAIKASGSGTIQRRYRDGLVMGDQYQEEMRSILYTDPEIVHYLVLAQLEFDTNLRSELLSAYRSGYRTDRISHELFRELLQQLGIRQELIDAYVEQETLRQALEDPTADEVEVRATGSSTVRRRYSEGWIPRDQAREEMRGLGYLDPIIDLQLVLADLEFDYDWKQDILAYLRDAFRRGEVSADDFLAHLTALGMDQGRAQTHLAREQVKRLPTVTVEAAPEALAAYLTPTGKLRVQEARELYRDDQITAPEYRQRLSLLEMPEDLVDATVDLEMARKGIPVLEEPPEVLPYYETDEGKLRLKTVLEAFRRQLIDTDETLAALQEQDRLNRISDWRLSTRLYRELQDLGMAEGLALGYVDYEVVRRTEPVESE